MQFIAILCSFAIIMLIAEAAQNNIDENDRPSWQDLPQEMIDNILNRVEFKDLYSVMQTSKDSKDKVLNFAPGFRQHGAIQKYCQQFKYQTKKTFYVRDEVDEADRIEVEYHSDKCFMALSNLCIAQQNSKVHNNMPLEVIVYSTSGLERIRLLKGCPLDLVINADDYAEDDLDNLANTLENMKDLNIKKFHMFGHPFLHESDVVKIMSIVTAPGNQIEKLKFDSNTFANYSSFQVFMEQFNNPNNKVKKLTLHHSGVYRNSYEYRKRPIGNRGLAIISTALKSLNHIESISMSNNEFTGDGLAHFASALSDRESKLIHLNLHGNRIGRDGIDGFRSFAEALARSKITYLDLKRNDLNHFHIELLVDSLSGTRANLNSINLAANNVGPQGVLMLSQLLKHENNGIETLNLNNNALLDDSCSHLAGAISSSYNKLKKLSISSARLTDMCAKRLAQGLVSFNSKIESLDMSFNSITKDGAMTLFNVLAVLNNGIKMLHLPFNDLHFDAPTILALSEILASENCKLKRLSLVQYHEVKLPSLNLLKEAAESVGIDLSI